MIKSHGNFDQSQRELAKKTADALLLGNSISSLNTNGRDVLNTVWSRINSTENEPNREHLKNALMDALINSNEKNSEGAYKPVCLTGMCSRVLESLTILDTDAEISQPVKTTEILRNEIFTKAHKVMSDTLAAADPDTRNAYNSGTDTILADRVSKLESDIRQAMDSIRDDYPDINPNTISNIIEDAKAGI
jgi:hypothetical protein